MALNDWADRELGADERPERPLPSGRIRPGQALGAATGLTAAGLGLPVLGGGRAAPRTAVPLAAAIWVYDLLTGIAGARPGTEPSRMKPLVLVDVGLTPRLLGHMPNLTALARKGRQSNLSDLGEIHL